MSQQNQKFEFTYSAAQQEEIEAIRKKYLSPEAQADKMEQLRRLDAGVTQKAMIPALTVGILGTLVLGLGMSLIMTDIGAFLGISSPLLPGIVTGLAGMAGVIGAYPLYSRILARQRKKVAPQILRLAEELSQN